MKLTALETTYYIVRVTDSGQTIGRYHIGQPLTVVPEAFAATFDTREAAERVTSASGLDDAQVQQVTRENLPRLHVVRK